VREVEKLEQDTTELLKLPIEEVGNLLLEWREKHESLWNRPNLPKNLDDKLAQLEARVSKHFSILV
jgi:hypothetical protein